MRIIFDIDGTLLNIEHRVHLVRPPDRGRKDWVAFRAMAMGDKPNPEIHTIYRALHADPDNRIIICTGRMQSERSLTVHVLHDVYKLPRPEAMLMRSDNDYRADYVVKEEMLRGLEQLNLRPHLVFDDRKQVVNMWRRNGIRVCQVADGEF